MLPRHPLPANLYGADQRATALLRRDYAPGAIAGCWAIGRDPHLTLQRRSHLRSAALHARTTFRSFMVLCSAAIWRVGCAQASCTVAQAFKHATTFGVATAPASTVAAIYRMQTQ